jgi:hypothetical protein
MPDFPGNGTLYSVLLADSAAVNNSTALVNSGLSVNVGAVSGIYAVEACLILSGASTTSDYKIGLTAPTSWTADWNLGVQGGDVAAASTGPTAKAISDSATAGAGTAVKNVVSLTGVAIGDGTNTGTIKVQFAQATGTAENTFVKKGSWLRVTQIVTRQS